MANQGGAQAAPPGGNVSRMPIPDEKAAPKWNGKEKSVSEFLRSFEVSAAQANLTDDEKRTQLGRYCKRPEDQALLEQLPGFSKTWDDYKKDILKFFPMADPDRIYSMKSLNKLIAKAHRMKSFKDAKTFARYNWAFMMITGGLERKKLISTEEKGRKYSDGFPTKTRKQLVRRMEVQFLAHSPGNEYTFDQWYAAVTFIMDRDKGKASSDTSDEDSDDSDDEFNLGLLDSSDDEIIPKKKDKQNETSKHDDTYREPEPKVKEEPKLHDLLLKMNTFQDKVQNLSQAIYSINNMRNTRSGNVPRTNEP